MSILVVLIVGYSFFWMRSGSVLNQPQIENTLKIFQNPSYTFQFEYPSGWNIANQTGTSRVLLMKDETGSEVITIDTGVNISVMGISYCGANLKDSRCESLKTKGGNVVFIDWGTSTEANALITSQDGTHGVSLTLHKVNSETKNIFKQILSSFTSI